MPTQPAALAVENAALHSRDGRTLVSGLHLFVEPGTCWAIVGPNGAGKTSLLRLMAGAVAPSAGAVRLDGRAVAALRPGDRARRIAMVAQTDAPDLRLPLRDYVELGRLPHRGRVGDGRHRAAVADALARVGLTALAGRALGALSGGERQRGAIARALAQEPGLLLLDEPTNHLDPRARADILALVRALGITVVAVLHDLALVAPFADHVAVLRQGALVVQGPPTVALAPAIVREVFDLDSFEAVNPASGRPVLVFDTPTPAPIERTHHAFPRACGDDRARPLPRRTGLRLSGDGG
ncbi:MAG: ABC transporter ATP-binding protein [Caulobacteraceae bacterium]|nr:ABC transporter ATP-binding protein [Caulobacter sp.]